MLINLDVMEIFIYSRPIELIVFDYRWNLLHIDLLFMR